MLFSNRSIFLIIMVCILSSIFGFVFAYNSFSFIARDEEFPNFELAKEEDEFKNQEEEIVEVSTLSNQEKITASTKLIYQYYYPDEDIVNEQEEIPPYFLVDVTIEDLQKYYSSWEIVSFSKEKVVMRKVIDDTKHQNYIVSVHDGVIAVFYDKELGEKILHEITDISIANLSHAEKVRLNDGIIVSGDEDLNKILEDYGS